MIAVELKPIDSGIDGFKTIYTVAISFDQIHDQIERYWQQKGR